MRKTIVGFLFLSFWLTLTVGMAMGQPTAEPQPVLVPVIHPLSAPAAISSTPLSITTFFTGGNSFAGNMFDVTNISSNPIVINSFDIHLETGGTGADISIYYTPNTYVGKEIDSSQWTLMGTDTVDAVGDNLPTPVNIGGLVLAPGASYGFYATVSNYPAAIMQYTNGSNVISNADLSLTLGVGKGNPDFTGNTFANRSWNGTIYYIPYVPEISLNKTVGTDSATCAGTDTVTVPVGSEVTYCFEVTNTGLVTTSLHTLVDDQLGTVLNNYAYALAPGASAFLTATTAVYAPITNTATWSAVGSYAYNDTVAYDFQDISATGTPLNLTDDGEGNVTMPFSFTFDGLTSNDLRVGNNGGILFGTTTGDVFAENISLPSVDFTAGILPFWDDLDDETGNVYVEALGSAPNRRYVVQWHNRPHFNNIGNATFQVILYEGSNEILFQYADVDFGDPTVNNGASATVGLQLSATQAATYSFNQSVITNGLAILWSPGVAEATDTAVVLMEDGVELSADQQGTADAGQPTPYTIHITNTGTVPTTYNFTSNSSEGWSVSFNPTSIPLNAGASGAVEVNITPVQSVVYGTWDTTAVIATSATNSNLTDTLNLLTTVNAPAIGVNPTSVEATVATEGSTNQILTIQNTGGSNLDWWIAEEAAVRGTNSPNTVNLIARGNGVANGATAADLATEAEAAEATNEMTAEALAQVDVFAPTAVLYDNGPLVNGPNMGFGGADASILETALGMNLFGFGHQIVLTRTIADDFTIPAGQSWTVDSVTFYAYETTSPITSTITAYNYTVYDGPPNDGGNVVFSGNTLLNSSWSGIYRVLDYEIQATNRPIMANTVDFGGLTLAAGTYWLEWQAEGSLGSGPWAPPIAVSGQITTGNALQNVNGVWQPALDLGQQGFPFVMQGDVVGCTTDIPWLSAATISGTTVADGSSPLNLTFDATGYAEGVYTGTLCINSEFPAALRTTIPVTMTVTNPTIYLPFIHR